MNFQFRIILFIGWIFCSCNSNAKFDKELWSNSGGENITIDTRLNMSRELLESKILINKSKDEIIDLLGSPSIIHGKVLENKMCFIVKEEYGMDIDPIKMIYIKVDFDQYEKAKSADLFCRKNE